MAVPDQATLQDLLDEAVTLGFMSGTDNAVALASYEIAWEMADRAVGTNLLATGTDCEAYAIPTGWIDHNERFGFIQTNRHHLDSIASVTITHDQFTCDCDEQDVSACAVIYHGLYGHIRLEDCWGPANCACSSSGRPAKVEICATYGLFGTVAELPQSIKTALALIATWWSRVMMSGGADASSGFVDSWRSMDYSESLGFMESNVIGAAPELAAAWLLLRKHRVMRAVGIRGSYPAQRQRQ